MRVFFTLLAILIGVGAAFAAFTGIVISSGDPTVGILPSYNDAYANWSLAGLVQIGGYPTRNTQCGATLTPSGGDDLTQIQNAINACTTGQVVQLGSGTFKILQTETIDLNKAITLRGTGTCNNGSAPYCASIIQVSNGTLPTYVVGGQCGVDTSHVVGCSGVPAIFMSGASNIFDWGWNGCAFGSSATGCSIALDVDAAQGDTTIRVHAQTNLSVGMFVRIDELSGGVLQADPAGGTAQLLAASDFTSATAGPPTGRIAYAGTMVEDGQGYGALYDRETSEIHKISAMGAGPCPGVACTLTFDSQLTIAFRTGHSAQVYRPTNQNGSSTLPFLQQAGLENLTITRSGGPPVSMIFCAYCWLKNVEASFWNGGVVISNSARNQIDTSYIHDCADCENNGVEYPLSFDGASTENLAVNNIIHFTGKGMVGRSAGGGNVVAYNYQDDTFYMAQVIGNFWVDMGVNASHYVGSHHFLFEGNWGDNCDNDETHGNTVYHTYFRNQCSGIRTTFNDPSFSTATSATFDLSKQVVNDTANSGFATGQPYPIATGPHRGIGVMRWDYWMAWVGNVIGTSGVSTTGNGWVYQAFSETTDNTIYKLGWSGSECQPEPCSDKYLNGSSGNYYFRHGNYDYVTPGVNWDSGFADHVLTNSFYLAGQPSFFGVGASCSYPWPWITPTSGTVIQPSSGPGACSTHSGLPAKARFDAGTPFVQP